jgi:hypothetical protein
MSGGNTSGGINLQTLNTAKTALAQALAQVYAALAINGQPDPFTTQFEANSTGLDKLRDLVKFTLRESDQAILMASGISQTTVTKNSDSATSQLQIDPTVAQANLSTIGSLIASYNQA